MEIFRFSHENYIKTAYFSYYIHRDKIIMTTEKDGSLDDKKSSKTPVKFSEQYILLTWIY